MPEKAPKVFLSHNSRDKPWVTQLADRLAAANIEYFFDDRDILAGAPIDEVLEKNLAECDFCLVLLGSHGVGPWHNEEIRSWIWKNVSSAGTNKKGIITVLLPGATRELAEKLLPTPLHRRRWIEFPDAPSDELAFNLLVRSIRGETRAAVVGAATNALPPLNLPYLCNRNEQEDQLRGFVESRRKSDVDLRRPLLFLLHGPAHEAHIPFVERLEKRNLPAWLGQWVGSANLRGQVKRLPMERPMNTQDPDAFAASYRSRIMASVQSEGPCESDADLLARLTGAGIVLAAPTLELTLDELLEPRPLSYLHLIHDYWARFPDLDKKVRIFAFVAVKTPAETSGGKGWFQSFLPISKAARAEKQFKSLLEGLPGRPEAPAIALPILEPAKRGDVSRWSQHPEVAPNLPQYLSDRHLETIFSGQLCLPMDDAIDRLTDLIQGAPVHNPN